MGVQFFNLDFLDPCGFSYQPSFVLMVKFFSSPNGIATSGSKMVLQLFWDLLLQVVRAIRLGRLISTTFWKFVHDSALLLAEFATPGTEVALPEDLPAESSEFIVAFVIIAGLVVLLAFGCGTFLGLWLNSPQPALHALRDRELLPDARVPQSAGPERMQTPPPRADSRHTSLKELRSPNSLLSPHDLSTFPVPLVAPVAYCDQRPLHRDLFHSPSPR